MSFRLKRSTLNHLMDKADQVTSALEAKYGSGSTSGSKANKIAKTISGNFGCYEDAVRNLASDLTGLTIPTTPKVKSGRYRRYSVIVFNTGTRKGDSYLVVNYKKEPRTVTLADAYGSMIVLHSAPKFNNDEVRYANYDEVEAFFAMADTNPLQWDLTLKPFIKAFKKLY